MTGYSAPSACSSHQHHGHSSTTVRHNILLADGSALFGDCGEAGTSDAMCSSNSAAVAASHATPVRKYAYRDAVLESADAHIPRNNCPPKYQMPAAAPATSRQDTQGMQRTQVAGNRDPVFVMASRPINQYQQYAMECLGNPNEVRPISGAGIPRSSIAAPPAALRQDTQGMQRTQVAGNRDPVFVMASRPINQYQQYAMECLGNQNEVRPISGVGIPRSSIGVGHPRGPIAQVVSKPVDHRAGADLSPLLPCTYPPNQYVVNPPDGDHYHRTSVYAASGLPIDMPAYTGPRTWTERMQHARP